MASRTGRRSRALDSDDEDSRPNTPSSTAPNDGKRQRRTYEAPGDDDEDGSQDEASTPSTAPESILPRGRPTPAPTNSTAGRQSGHLPGAIVRVKLTNFVTYTSAEFFPGPNLNMVIGPNGTGKSTLVCAICLGLGWPPSYLGRAKDAVEFIKHGSREATIEIELKRAATSPKNPIIVRVIKREGSKSTYMLNGGSTTGRKVQELANSFNIQIDNLCQFLPQDKVVEFAQMSPIELLASTQRAVAGPEMSKMHEDLKKLRSAQSEALNRNKADQELMANLENRQEMQRTEVERMRERALVQKRLKWMEKCRPLVEYAERRVKYKEAKQQAKSVTQELKRLRAVSSPTLKELESKRKYEKEVNILKEKRRKELATSERKCDEAAKAIADAQSSIDDLKNKLEAEKKTPSVKKSEINRYLQQMENLKRARDQPPELFDVTAMTDEIQNLKNQHRAVEEQKTGLNSREERLKTQYVDNKRKRDELEKSLKGMQTGAGKQEAKLQFLSKDTFQAWEWIQKNRDEFSQHVYGPPIVECSLKNSTMADAVESLLQPTDFKIITVQNKADFIKLQGKLSKGLKLHDFSLRVCPVDNLDQARRPLPAEEMERFGLTSWAIDHLEGPGTVLAMLCAEKNLHRCAMSSRELSQQQHDQLAATSIFSYVAGRKVYQFMRRAEYGTAGTSSRVSDVRPAKFWTDQPVDMGRQAAVQRDLNEALGEKQIIQDELKNGKDETSRLDTRMEELKKAESQKREEKEQKQRAKAAYNKLDAQIEEKKEKIRNVEKLLAESKERVKELVARWSDALVTKSEAVLAFTSAVADVKVKSSALLEAEVLHIEASSDLEALTAQNEQVVQTIQLKEVEVADANKAYEVHYKRARELFVDCERTQAEAQKLERDENDSGFVHMIQHMASDVKTLESLEGEIDAEKAKLELTEGGSASIIKEYEDRAKVVEKLRAKLQDDAQKQADFNHSIREIRARWEGRLEAVVARINDAFSDSFARIGCAGQVAVYKASSDMPADCTEENGGADNGLDFANWAIHISVKFREQEPLSLLDSHRQSGGERAVSTIFYLMALQSLSKAPFRVVDEINQGMDPRNERMVHGRMVDIAADDGGSQYFLITPKLLSGLKYRRGMTVLCIVSGENMPAARQQGEDGRWVDGPKVDFRAFVQKAKQLGFGAPQNGRRFDSGVGMKGFETASQSTAVGA
ncbi:Structural maintenance of chromosomes protein 5 [Exophiala xenobiotica]|uniref:Structural maintenance of chromosomes protein 5 n=1 Tax=Vermiconidia calcicola TaxID=1690605 RepID=A0AAV9QHU2_9PEZI|nr:Structural maintenance of chromosomes protein 5 [Exophiala xenobiotica]KAK5533210.1 Structural maintenance of chromosomes protein 5 [Chaetothyriales sp. CCFEE 6169]KAK5542602.1 Structural maintenance of chromosomes protein 5 [Vermiconidia calcicola]KAK5306369.1 Structural maintenance of chromosomes protein 5 [Exophiala xenobiotica]KAK5341652.1 Structural maintenance of chromosomes protein 5 [Exophiala xenobiotica]